jgi:hypothetical protein
MKYTITTFKANAIFHKHEDVHPHTTTPLSVPLFNNTNHEAECCTRYIKLRTIT